MLTGTPLYEFILQDVLNFNEKIIVTEHHIEDRPVIAILEIDRNQGRIKVNSVRSLYDKKNEIFNEWINNPDFVEYENTEKSKVLLQSIDNQYVKEVTTPYSSDDTTNSDNVNGDIKNNKKAAGKQNVKPKTEKEIKEEKV